MFFVFVFVFVFFFGNFKNLLYPFYTIFPWESKCDGNGCCIDQARSIYNRSYIHLDPLHVSKGYSLLLDMVLVLSTQTRLLFTCYCWFEVCLLLLMSCSLACSFCCCSVYTHLLVVMTVDATKILKFTCFNNENYSLWVIHMEANLVS